MTLLVLVAVVAGALCWPRPRRPADRVRQLTEADGCSAANEAVAAAPALRRPIALAAGLAVVAAVVVGLSLWLIGLLAVASVVGARMRSKPSPRPDELALAADLMAACLSAGAATADALAAATVPAGTWLRQRSATVVDELRQGAPPEQAWASWLAAEELAPVARACVRTAGSGAAVAAELTRVAARMRSRERTTVEQRVARASVWVVLPLGLWFLPAFVAVGVVPLVLGLLRSLH